MVSNKCTSDISFPLWYIYFYTTVFRHHSSLHLWQMVCIRESLYFRFFGKIRCPKSTALGVTQQFRQKQRLDDKTSWYAERLKGLDCWKNPHSHLMAPGQCINVLHRDAGRLADVYDTAIGLPWTFTCPVMCYYGQYPELSEWIRLQDHRC